ncbi:MAG: hypothetical protein NNA22_01345 [Nitrospira sp.]|nr:hypothetical protein [Nitrospira sp.]
MDVEGDRGYLEGGVLGLARPDQLWIEVRVIGVTFRAKREIFLCPASGSVSGVTRPTGGLLMRSLSRCS